MKSIKSMKKDVSVMRMTRKSPALLTSLVGLMIVISTSGAANAVSIAPTADPLTMIAVSGQEAALKTEVAMSALASGAIPLQAPLNAVVAAESKVNTIPTANGAFTTVTIPISGSYSFTSNVSMVFDSAGNRLQSSEMLVSENADGFFNVKTYADGVMTNNQDTDLVYLTDAELKADLVASQAKSGSVAADAAPAPLAAKNTGACVATVLGVTGVVGAIIAYGCAGACAAAAVGVGVPFCIACIAGFATIGGASITAVATCF